ncbi:hypothetical protein DDK00_04750 [Mycobacteroides abscessus]|nr:hypothetical protein DDJ36_16030 [Mycobacteroides abscessus]PVA67695.1 hypothetical protein DDJ94_04750 [Mycobacteroides abscessus]PVA80519.1 hypothetical protein DDK00_04750 [Mycobacteroides abscessus]PVA88890.1 hypothetical protein DDJ75_04755 [Mycobacteroides abscessus]PVB39275.1 hypothetical protein DDJ91_13670 [Mycobacteroides abscessus]
MVGTWPGSRSNWLRTSPATPLPRAAQLHQLLALAYERGCRVWIGSRQRFGEQMVGSYSSATCRCRLSYGGHDNGDVA